MCIVSRRHTAILLLLLPLFLGSGWFESTKSKMEKNLWHFARNDMVYESGRAVADNWVYDLNREVRFRSEDMVINGVVIGQYKFIDKNHISFYKLGEKRGLHLRVHIVEVFSGTLMQWIFKNPNGTERVVYSFGYPDWYD